MEYILYILRKFSGSFDYGNGTLDSEESNFLSFLNTLLTLSLFILHSYFIAMPLGCELVPDRRALNIATHVHTTDLVAFLSCQKKKNSSGIYKLRI